MKDLLLDSRKRRRLTEEKNSDAVTSIPALKPDDKSGLIDGNFFLESYDAYQALYIPQALHRKGDDEASIVGDSKFKWQEMNSLFLSLNEEDQSSWTEENYKEKNKEEGDKAKRIPGSFLQHQGYHSVDNAAMEKGYCSFLVQHDKEKLKSLLKSLPTAHLPVSNQGTIEETASNTTDNEIMKMKYGPCLWFFYGRNDGGKKLHSDEFQDPLEGRPEHTDSVCHDGTFHYQLSGVKNWHIRPTDELLNNMKEKGIPTDTFINGKSINIRCEEGDMILLNTRLWWHRTSIPEQPLIDVQVEKRKTSSKLAVPSISYARDIYLHKEDGGDEKEDKNAMTNVDGLYACNDIESGTVIFTEADMPECELHRVRSDPNCEIVELDVGIGGVVSCRNIKAGEFFCVIESDEEDDFEEEFEEIEEEL
jgi:U3 small nucleolar RNA-associated protein 6